MKKEIKDLNNEVLSLFYQVESKFSKSNRYKYRSEIDNATNKNTLKALKNKFIAFLNSEAETVKRSEVTKAKNNNKILQDKLNRATSERNRNIRKYERTALGNTFGVINIDADDVDGTFGFDKSILDHRIVSKNGKLKSGLAKIIFNTINSKLEHIKKANRTHGLRCYVTIKYEVELEQNESQLRWYNSEIRNIPTHNSIISFVVDLLNAFYEDITVSKNGSNFSFKCFDSIKIKFNVYQLALGKSYIPLPDSIANKKACINIKNNDDKCFDWCLLVHKHNGKLQENSHRLNETNTYKEFWDTIKRPVNVQYPVDESQIAEYENLNNMQINVFELMDNDESKDPKTRIQQIYKADVHRPNVCNLLLIRNEDNFHYVYVKSLSRLFSYTSNYKSKLLCPHCLKSFNTNEKMLKHVSLCSNATSSNMNRLDVSIVCPKPKENILEFKNIDKTFKHPFHVVADFESTLESVVSDSSCNTKKYQKHVPNSYGLKFCSIHKEYDDDVKIFNNSDPEEVTKSFVEQLEEFAFKSYELIKQNAENIIDFNHFLHNSCSKCYYCKCSFTKENKKVAHHDHVTGQYIAPACNNCNLQLRYKNFLPVYIHNLKGYDAHLFINALNKYGQQNKEISCIPNNEERYISFSKIITVGKAYDEEQEQDVDVKFEIRFLDTIAFMNSSISDLVDNLASGNNTITDLRKAFPNTSKHFTNDEQFKLMTMKGIYPYDFIDSYDKLNVKMLPEQDKFYSRLYDSNCSDEDYKQACTVWKTFKCKSFLDYHNIYLKSDVLILADIWESFRNTCYKNYDLDCTYYFTAPGLSFDAMLKFTKIKLELFTDIDMYEFVESGIRGGISMISNRYAKANNKYMSNYDPKKEDNYIVYLDANNLYGWAMSQCMPHSGFKWNHDEWTTEKIMAIDRENDKGYMFEVDLHIPDELHDKFNNYVPCPENISIKKDYLSEWQQHNYTESKITKLCTTFLDKNSYVVNYRYLQLCLSLGVELKRVHRVLQFNQCRFLKDYIELNTDLRKKASNDFEKDFFKLMNNSVFGKTMENVRNRINFKLISTEEQAWRVKNLNRFTIFDENLVGVHIQKQKVTLNKPVYLGQTILDDSKYLMYDFHYNFMLNKIPREDVDLLFTDTDSLCYNIRKHDIFEIMKTNKDYFDLSNYPKNSELYDPKNNKVIGKFKNESVVPITEFVGLRAKLYAYSVDNDDHKHLKCKGVKKNVVQKDLNIDKYRNVLFNRVTENIKQNGIRSYSHQIYTEETSKTALSYCDDKVHICDDNIHTYNFGHYKTRK